MRKSFLGVLTLSASLVLAGCQTTGGSLFGGSNSNVDPQLTQGRQAEFFSKSGWQACAIGAGAGIAGCLLSNAGNKVACSAIVAVAACGVLMGTNYYLEQQRKTYSDKEERLNAYIDAVRKDTEEVKILSDSAKRVLTKNAQTLKSLDAKLKSGKIAKTAAEQQLAEVDANIKYLNDKLVKMKETEKNWREVSAQEKSGGMKVKKLDTQIKALNKQINVLERQVATVSKQRTAIKLG